MLVFRRRQSLHRQLLLLHHSKFLSTTTTTSLPLHLPLSHPAYMIWGSNTSLGKTLVSTGLASSFLLSPPHSSTTTTTKRKFLYLKPIQTGFPSDSDSHFVFSKLSSLVSLRNPPVSFLAFNSVFNSSLSAAKSLTAQPLQHKFGINALNFHEKNQVLKGGEGAAVSELVCETLYAWKEAVSPHLAAEREKGVVEDSTVVETLEKCLISGLVGEGKNGKIDAFCVVETSGGVASPGPSGTLQCDLYRYVTLLSVLNGVFAYYT